MYKLLLKLYKFIKQKKNCNRLLNSRMKKKIEQSFYLFFFMKTKCLKTKKIKILTTYTYSLVTHTQEYFFFTFYIKCEY